MRKIKIGRIVKKIAKNYFTITGILVTGFVGLLVFEDEISKGARRIKNWWNGDYSSESNEGEAGDNDDGWSEVEEDEFEEDEVEEDFDNEADEKANKGDDFNQSIAQSGAEQADVGEPIDDKEAES